MGQRIEQILGNEVADKLVDELVECEDEAQPVDTLPTP